jgi:hypothetical protein
VAETICGSLPRPVDLFDDEGRRRRRSVFDDVVNVENLWLVCEINSNVRKEGHQLLTERMHLLL